MNGKKAAETRRAGERLRHAQESAQHCFARASALLTEPSPDNKGEALFHAALGLLRLAQSDPEQAALEKAENVLRFFTGQPIRPAVPGPYSGT